MQPNRAPGLAANASNLLNASACALGAANPFAMAGVAVTALLSGQASADETATTGGEQQSLPGIEVTGTAIQAGHDISQSIDTVDRKELEQQHLTLLQDALRNVP